jgi:hypothetical protein
MCSIIVIVNKMIRPDKRGSKHGVVMVTYSGNPLKHQFQFIDLPKQPVIIATDIYAAANQIKEEVNDD